MLLKIVYLLTCRVLSPAVLVFRGDRAKDAELLLLRHENAVLRRHALIRGQLGALIVVFVWAMAIEQIISRVSPTVGRFMPLLSATTMAGANSTASMPPVSPGLHPLEPALVAVLLAVIVAVLAAAAGVVSAPKDVT